MNANVMQPLELMKERGARCFFKGEYEQALRVFEECLKLNGRDAQILNYRARCLEGLDRTQEALAAIDQALAINPDNLADLRNRGILLRRLGRLGDALTSFETVLRSRPRDLDLLIKRVHLLIELDRREEALPITERLVSSYPGDLAALNARGMVLESLQRYEEALSVFEHMAGMRPDYLDAINNAGMIKARLGRWAEALTDYDRSLRLQPQQPQAMYNRSLVRLALGDWGRGLEEFESRWDTPPLKSARLTSLAPQWGGEDLTGKTLLVYHEQGYGDTLQCARYVPLLLERGARVILAVPPALYRLMQTLQGGVTVIWQTDALPPHDLQCPLMSLLRLFGTTPTTIPVVPGYLRSNAEEVLQWRQRLGRQERPRIGLAWSGRRYAPINYPRDLSLSLLRPLLDLDADFFCLQTEMSKADHIACEQIPNLRCDHSAHLRNFADTAALLETMDLVISVDTAIAHLAGALNKPVWLLNRHASCWRWGQQGPTTAWYPSMRIFRQPNPGDWQEVVKQVGTATASFIERTNQSHSSSTGHSALSTIPKETIRFVCATRLSGEQFLKSSPLGRSLKLYRDFPKGQRIELRLFPNNRQGLSTVYNIAIDEAARDPAILVFIHDDVYLNDYFWADRLRDGLQMFDVIGLAGNRRRVSRQPSWMYLDETLTQPDREHLSGVVGHGQGFPNLKQLSVYGPPGQECKLLDGLLLAARSAVIAARALRFDTRFAFHFYDMDFCRQAELKGVRMGTWPMSVIHESGGGFGSDTWRTAYKDYLVKYGST